MRLVGGRGRCRSDNSKEGLGCVVFVADQRVLLDCRIQSTHAVLPNHNASKVRIST